MNAYQCAYCKYYSVHVRQMQHTDSHKRDSIIVAVRIRAYAYTVHFGHFSKLAALQTSLTSQNVNNTFIRRASVAYVRRKKYTYLLLIHLTTKM